jgi:hypothetical protein
MNTVATIYRDLTQPIPVNAIAPLTPRSKAQAMRNAFAQLVRPGDAILQGYGDFDWSDSDVQFPAGVTIRGMGRGLTRNFSSWFDWDGIKRVAFKLGDGTKLQQMSMKQVSTEPLGVDGICVGFAAPNLSATLRDVDIWGREWALYGWQPDCNLLCEDFTITGGRVCVASENSGDGQNFNLRRGTIIGDMSLSQSGPSLDVSNPRNGGVFGVVHRGGLLTLDDVRIKIKGAASTAAQPMPPRACAITDTGGDNSGPSGNTAMELFNVWSTVDPNGCDPDRCFDLDIQTDYVRPNVRVAPNCWGGAPDGTLSRSWK